MTKKRNIGRPRKMKPVVLVICEGETEKEYITFLRGKYRFPIEIKILGDDINNRIVEKVKNAVKLNGKDIIRTFLMYDRDVPSINNIVDGIKGELLCSNPCVELWFILHITDQLSEISSNSCINLLKMQNDTWNKYKKSSFTDKQKTCLWNNRLQAAERAKKLKHFNNPSSTVYRLIDYLEDFNACGNA